MKYESAIPLLADMRHYLSQLKPTECPVSLDNWAAMANLEYREMRAALLHLDLTLYRDYIRHRQNFWRSIEQELRALKGSPDYTADYTRPIAEKYDITMRDVQRIRSRLGMMCSPKISRVAEEAMKFVRKGMTLRDLAEASGFTLAQIKGAHGRGHFDKWAAFSYEKRVCANGRRQNVLVVSKLKSQGRPRHRRPADSQSPGDPVPQPA